MVRALAKFKRTRQATRVDRAAIGARLFNNWKSRCDHAKLADRHTAGSARYRRVTSGL